MEQEVRVVEIEISNVKGLPKAQLHFRKPEPGKGQLITIIGDNGAGKSSALQAIEGLFKGGYDPDLIRDGADKAEIRMLLSNGTDIRRVITRKTVRLDIKTEDGTPVRAPESYVKKLASGFGFDPIKFVTAKKGDRLKYLLNVMPLVFTSAELATAMNVKDERTDSLDITGINRIIKELTEKRAVIGSRRDERAATVETFRKTLLTSDQGDTPKDWRAMLADLEKKRDGIISAEATEISEIETQLRDARTQISMALRKFNDDTQAEFQRLLSEARSGDPKLAGLYDVDITCGESNDLLSVLGTALSSIAAVTMTLNNATKEAQEATDRVRSENATTLATLSGEIAEAKSAFESQVRSGAIREQMEKSGKEAKALSAEWDAIAKSIKNVEELRKSKLKELPVEGLEVREDGDIYINGRQFDQWNTGFKFMKSIEIGAVGAGELGLIICDDTVHLGPDLWKHFGEAVAESGLTVIAARLAKEEEIAAYGPGLRSEPALALQV